MKEPPPWVLSASAGVASSSGPGSGGWDFDIFSNKGLCLASAPACCILGASCLPSRPAPPPAPPPRHRMPGGDQTTRPSQAPATFIFVGKEVPSAGPGGGGSWGLAVRLCAQDPGCCLASTLYTVIDSNPLVGGSGQSQGQPLRSQELGRCLWKEKIRDCYSWGSGFLALFSTAAFPTHPVFASGPVYTGGCSSGEKRGDMGKFCW